jgi:hypothetical protein
VACEYFFTLLPDFYGSNYTLSPSGSPLDRQNCRRHCDVHTQEAIDFCLSTRLLSELLALEASMATLSGLRLARAGRIQARCLYSCCSFVLREGGGSLMSWSRRLSFHSAQHRTGFTRYDQPSLQRCCEYTLLLSWIPTRTFPYAHSHMHIPICTFPYAHSHMHTRSCTLINA